MATILILDNDLGFAFWLGQSLTASQCTALPALSVAEASSLIGHFKLQVDLLILNPAVAGAEEFAQGLRKEQKQMRVATLTPEAGAGNRPRPVQTVIARES